VGRAKNTKPVGKKEEEKRNKKMKEASVKHAQIDLKGKIIIIIMRRMPFAGRLVINRVVLLFSSHSADKITSLKNARNILMMSKTCVKASSKK